jgi:hypothetical protein
MNGRRILVPVNLEQSTFDALHFVAGLAGELPICATLLYVGGRCVPPQSQPASRN